MEYAFEPTGSTLTSKSTLPLLVEELRPSKVLILVLDTVAQADEGVRSYEDVTNQVKRRYEEFLEELGVSGEVRVEVAPGVGSFPNGSFHGSMADFYYLALEALAREIPAGRSELTIHLDLTHGINYMPALAYRAVRELAGLAAMAGRVRLRVYNSEPYSGRAKRLGIHVVEDAQIRPVVEASLISGKGYLEPTDPRDADGKRYLQQEVLEGYRELGGELNAFLGAAAGGLPLALYTFYPERDRLERFVERLLSEYREHVSVEVSDGRVEVRRRFRFGEDFSTLTKAGFLAASLCLCRKPEVSVRELKVVRERVFSRIRRLDAAISYDLDFQIARRGLDPGRLREKGIAPGEWNSLSSILTDRRVSSTEPDLRTFLRHSGLQAMLVEFMIPSAGASLEETLLRYSKSYLGTIKNFCASALRVG